MVVFLNVIGGLFLLAGGIALKISKECWNAVDRRKARADFKIQNRSHRR